MEYNFVSAFLVFLVFSVCFSIALNGLLIHKILIVFLGIIFGAFFGFFACLLTGNLFEGTAFFSINTSNLQWFITISVIIFGLLSYPFHKFIVHLFNGFFGGIFFLIIGFLINAVPLLFFLIGFVVGIILSIKLYDYLVILTFSFSGVYAFFTYSFREEFPALDLSKTFRSQFFLDNIAEYFQAFFSVFTFHIFTFLIMLVATSILAVMLQKTHKKDKNKSSSVDWKNILIFRLSAFFFIVTQLSILLPGLFAPYVIKYFYFSWMIFPLFIYFVTIFLVKKSPHLLVNKKRYLLSLLFYFILFPIVTIVIQILSNINELDPYLESLIEYVDFHFYGYLLYLFSQLSGDIGKILAFLIMIIINLGYAFYIWPKAYKYSLKPFIDGFQAPKNV